MSYLSSSSSQAFWCQDPYTSQRAFIYMGCCLSVFLIEDIKTEKVWCFYFLSLFTYLSNLYIQHGTRTYDPKIKSHVLFQLSQLAIPKATKNFRYFLKIIINYYILTKISFCVGEKLFSKTKKQKILREAALFLHFHRIPLTSGLRKTPGFSYLLPRAICWEVSFWLKYTVVSHYVQFCFLRFQLTHSPL